MGKNRKNECRVRLAECGQNILHQSFPKISGKCALEVCNKALNTMIISMIGKENLDKGIYLLSLFNLQKVHNKFAEKFPELEERNVKEYLTYFKVE